MRDQHIHHSLTKEMSVWTMQITINLTEVALLIVGLAGD